MSDLLETKLLDKQPAVEKLTSKEKTVVDTALRLIDDNKTRRSDRVQKAKRNKALIKTAIGGQLPTRLTSFPSYLVYHVVKLFSTLVDIPDKNLIIPGVKEQKKFLMAAFLDKVMRDGGYNDALQSGWSGYDNMALNGDLVLTMGLKQDGKSKGMPVFQQVPAETVSYNRLARMIRTRTGVGAVGRYAFPVYLTLQSAEQHFPGILDVCLPGDLPSQEQLENLQELTEEQRSEIRKNEAIQILQFVDKDFKTTAIIGGANAGLYSMSEGDDFPYVMEIDGEKQPFINIVKGTFQFLPEGIDGVGSADMFGSLSDIQTKLNSSHVNNTIDNINAAPIVNIPGVKASTIFQQEKMTRKAIEEGKKGFMTFDPAENNGQQLGQASINYLRNTFPDNESQIDIDRLEQVLLRSGWNLDFLFTNPNKTNLQTELDIEANNQNIIDIQSKNLDFYKVPAEFAIYAIRKFGSVTDKRLFGTDLELEIEGETVKLGEMMESKGVPAITNGDMVRMFKENKFITVEVDVKSGVSFNSRIEERNLLKRMRFAAPGSPEFMKISNALSMLNGGKAVEAQEAASPGGQIGAIDSAQTAQNTLAL